MVPIVQAGVHRAPAIRVAEAAKVIGKHPAGPEYRPDERTGHHLRENGHRHAGRSGGGRQQMELPAFQAGSCGRPYCIGVDPYYLTLRPRNLGYGHSFAGRQVNDNMGKYVAECAVKRLIRQDSRVNGARVGILGFTFGGKYAGFAQ